LTQRQSAREPSLRSPEEVPAAEVRRWDRDEITRGGGAAGGGEQPEAVLDVLLARGAPHVPGASLR